MNLKIKHKIIGLILLLLNSTSNACNITLTSCQVRSWPGHNWAVSSHADPLGWLKRRWFNKCTLQISDLKSLMEHGDISICSCISTIQLVCKPKTPFLFGVCISNLCTKQSTHDKLKKQASNSNTNSNTNENRASSSITITNTPPNHTTNMYKYSMYILISLTIIILFYAIYKQCQTASRCIKRWTPMLQQTNQPLTGNNNEALTTAENKLELPNVLPSYKQRKPITTEIELN